MIILRYPWRAWFSECFLSPRPEEGNRGSEARCQDTGQAAKRRPRAEGEGQGSTLFPSTAAAAFQFGVLKFEIGLLSQSPILMPALHRYSFVTGNTVISKLAVHGHLLLGDFLDLQPQQTVFFFFLRRSQQASLLYTHPLPACDL